MTKVIQVRGVPDDVHSKLVKGARQAGKSLNAYLVAELEQYVRRLDAIERNRRIFDESHAEFASLEISRADTRRAIDESRAERDRELDERIVREHPA